MPVFLAHGSLGPFDEILFVSVAVIFVVMMGISWVKSRNRPPLEDDTPESAPPAPVDEAKPANHFPLE